MRRWQWRRAGHRLADGKADTGAVSCARTLAGVYALAPHLAAAAWASAGPSLAAASARNAAQSHAAAARHQSLARLISACAPAGVPTSRVGMTQATLRRSLCSETRGDRTTSVDRQLANDLNRDLPRERIARIERFPGCHDASQCASARRGTTATPRPLPLPLNELRPPWQAAVSDDEADAGFSQYISRSPADEEIRRLNILKSFLLDC